jgi:hypothetical protein
MKNYDLNYGDYKNCTIIIKHSEEERQLNIYLKEEAEIKRREAEKDPSLYAKVPIVSKKEQDAIKEAKNKQGVRMRKTGARRKKYEGPGASTAK